MKNNDDVIKWKHFPRYWPLVRGILRSPVNSPHKGQWRRALMFTLICARINGWVNNRDPGDLRCYRPHYDVIVMHNDNMNQTDIYNWFISHLCSLVVKEKTPGLAWTLRTTAYSWYSSSYLFFQPSWPSYYTPRFNEVKREVYWFHLVRLSVRPSVCRIHFIFAHLIKQLQKVSHV